MYLLELGLVTKKGQPSEQMEKIVHFMRSWRSGPVSRLYSCYYLIDAAITRLAMVVGFQRGATPTQHAMPRPIGASSKVRKKSRESRNNSVCSEKTNMVPTPPPPPDAILFMFSHRYASPPSSPKNYTAFYEQHMSTTRIHETNTQQHDNTKDKSCSHTNRTHRQRWQLPATTRPS